MNQPILEFRETGKRFFGTPVLKNVSFVVPPGGAVGLVGENGAGKSTLMNILAGVLRADSGRILLQGSPFEPATPEDATRAGVALVHQELNLFENLTIAENLSLTDFPQRRLAGIPWIHRRNLQRRARQWLDVVHLSLNPDTLVARLSPGERQLVEIAKALSGRPRILVFDEPTTSLTRPESERLFQMIDRLRAEGVSIIYISHSLGDVLRICDQIVVLRDGEVQAVGPAEDFTIDRMITLMVGRSLERLFPRRNSQPRDEIVLQVEGLSQPGIVENVGFSLRRGELLGLAGLMGSGRTELARILFGLDPHQRGEIRVCGRRIARPSPARCICRGMAHLTEDRRGEGLLMEANVEDNMALVSLPQFAPGGFGLIRRRQLSRQTSEMAQSLSVDCRSMQKQPVKTLSGGNQQKVVLAKWLLQGADVFILDEPTRGVDVGARYEIYSQINDLAARGAGVLMISSEFEELVGLCDRILVMARGEIQSTVERSDFDRNAMLRSALGKERLQ